MKNIDIQSGTVEIFEWSHITEIKLAEFEDQWKEVRDKDLQILHICSFCALLGNDHLETPHNFDFKIKVVH